MKSNYALKWIIQRATAIFLIPLSLWFIYNCIRFQHYNYLELKLFFQSYINSFLFLIMMFIMLIHGKLGCETIVQDYISSLYWKKTFKNIINFFSFSSLFLVIVAIIKLNII